VHIHRGRHATRQSWSCVHGEIRLRHDAVGPGAVARGDPETRLTAAIPEMNGSTTRDTARRCLPQALSREPGCLRICEREDSRRSRPWMCDPTRRCKRYPSRAVSSRSPPRLVTRASGRGHADPGRQALGLSMVPAIDRVCAAVRTGHHGRSLGNGYTQRDVAMDATFLSRRMAACRGKRWPAPRRRAHGSRHGR
jgi:hypothetical protein